MTVKEMLKLSFGYPIEDKYLETVISGRKLEAGEEFTEMTAVLWLARADLFRMLALSPQISDDSGSVALPPRELLLSQAENIYRIYEPKSAKLCASRGGFKDASSIW